MHTCVFNCDILCMSGWVHYCVNTAVDLCARRSYCRGVDFEFAICNAQLISSACINVETEGPLGPAFVAASFVNIRDIHSSLKVLKWFEDSQNRSVFIFFFYFCCKENASTSITIK